MKAIQMAREVLAKSEKNGEKILVKVGKWYPMLHSNRTAIKQLPEEMLKKENILYMLWDLGKMIFRYSVENGNWLLLIEKI